MDLQIGKNIKTLRTRRGITQETLAARLGVAPQSVSKWERGEGYPDITFLIPLADYFGVPLDTLMGRNEEEREQKIADILRQYEHFRHIGNHNAKKSLIQKAYEEFPFDFRIIVKYVESLICSDDPSSHRGEIERLTSLNDRQAAALSAQEERIKAQEAALEAMDTAVRTAQSAAEAAQSAIRAIEEGIEDA